MTLLTICRAVCDIVSLPRPTTIVGETSQTTRALLTLAQVEGRELSRRHGWQALQVDHTFTSIAAEVQTGAVPSDLDRFVDETFWNRSRSRMVMGPLTAEEWATLKATAVPAVTDVWRQRGGSILILPEPTAGQTYAYTYISKNWCLAEDGTTTRAAWAADTDTGRIDESIHTLGIAWRYLQSRGMDYAEAMATYEREVSRAIAKDGGRRRMSFGGEQDYRPRAGVQEGDWYQ